MLDRVSSYLHSCNPRSKQHVDKEVQIIARSEVFRRCETDVGWGDEKKYQNKEKVLTLLVNLET